MQIQELGTPGTLLITAELELGASTHSATPQAGHMPPGWARPFLSLLLLLLLL